VASGGGGIVVRAGIDATGLAHLFDTVVTREDADRGKPAPDLFLEAARRLGVPAQRCLVVEDAEEGLAAARAAGMHAVDVRPYVTSGW
jgi:HAD superfamily hydrolase (TIGR01509 family)